MHPSLFISYPKALLTSISLPMEMINAAVAVARIKQAKNNLCKCYVIDAGSKNHEQGKPLTFMSGLRLQADFHLTTAPQANIIFVPPIWGKPEVVVEHSKELIEWLTEQHALGVKICATGTGVCLLAKAGLLDGKVATTHWYYFKQFEQKYPQVNLQKRHFITQAGNLYCCASINALVDLVLYFIESYFSKEVSQVIEQHFSHEISRTYEKPWYSSGDTRHPDERIIEVQQWILSHHSRQNINLQELAQMANMSVRNFTRRFKLAAGKSALDYIMQLKIQTAMELLKKTNLSHEDIADQLGFKDASYFSRQFKQINKITPSEYRKMVRGKLFNL